MRASGCATWVRGLRATGLRGIARAAGAPPEPEHRRGLADPAERTDEGRDLGVPREHVPAREDVAEVVLAAAGEGQLARARVGHVARDVEQVLRGPRAAGRDADRLAANEE